MYTCNMHLHITKMYSHVYGHIYIYMHIYLYIHTDMFVRNVTGQQESCMQSYNISFSVLLGRADFVGSG